MGLLCGILLLTRNLTVCICPLPSCSKSPHLPQRDKKDRSGPDHGKSQLQITGQGWSSTAWTAELAGQSLQWESVLQLPGVLLCPGQRELFPWESQQKQMCVRSGSPQCWWGLRGEDSPGWRAATYLLCYLPCWSCHHSGAWVLLSQPTVAKAI